MNANRSLTLTSGRNWGFGNHEDVGASSPDHERHQSSQFSVVPRPFHYRRQLEEGEDMYAPWRLFEERVRTGPYGLTRFPLQPYSPVRILILDGGGNEEIVNPRLRQFVRDSPPRIRGDWHLPLHLPPDTEVPALTDEEFKKAMKKLRKQVYNHPSPDYSSGGINSKNNKAGTRRGLFGNRTSSSATTAHGDRSSADHQGKNCTICLEAFVPNERVVVTPCNHTFHNDCIAPWVKSHGQCPVCRFSLCDRRSERSRALSRNNDYYYYNNNNTGSLGSAEDLAVDLISLIRAMDEAFNWVHLSR